MEAAEEVQICPELSRSDCKRLARAQMSSHSISVIQRSVMHYGDEVTSILLA